MFHCNGWCFPWTIAAVAGVNICIRKINPKEIFKLIKKHKVSNLCGTTVIINMLIEQKTKLKKKSVLYDWSSATTTIYSCSNREARI